MAGFVALLCVLSDAGSFTVAADGSANFKTVQAAVDAAPATGAVIQIRPGTYREKLVVAKPHIQLRGTGSDASQVILSYDDSAGTAGGTTKSASITVSGDDFYAANLTMENTFSRTRALTQEGSQAVALKITGDRGVLRNVRFLGFQDTLYAAGQPARQYFVDCYIEGNIDFIFVPDGRADRVDQREHDHAGRLCLLWREHRSESARRGGAEFAGIQYGGVHSAGMLGGYWIRAGIVHHGESIPISHPHILDHVSESAAGRDQ
jgi:Pectinesterase